MGCCLSKSRRRAIRQATINRPPEATSPINQAPPVPGPGVAHNPAAQVNAPVTIHPVSAPIPTSAERSEYLPNRYLPVVPTTAAPPIADSSREPQTRCKNTNPQAVDPGVASNPASPNNPAPVNNSPVTAPARACLVPPARHASELLDRANITNEADRIFEEQQITKREFNRICEEQTADDECHLRCFASRFQCSIFPHPSNMANVRAVANCFQMISRRRILHHWEHTGFSNPEFHPNRNLSPGNPRWDKFAMGLQGLGPTSRFALVFHATTSHRNLSSILTDGLDPLMRKRQKFGPGEYFARHPIQCLSYGVFMVVFVVVVPESVASHSCKDQHYIVVADNYNHLPIGHITFSEINWCRACIIHEHRLAWCKLREAEQALVQTAFRDYQTKMWRMKSELWILVHAKNDQKAFVENEFVLIHSELRTWVRKRDKQNTRDLAPRPAKRASLDDIAMAEVSGRNHAVNKAQRRRRRFRQEESERLSRVLDAINKSIEIFGRMDAAREAEFERDKLLLEQIRETISA